MIFAKILLKISFVLALSSVWAAALPVFKLSVKGGKFTPMRLVVPNNQKFKLLVHNRGQAPAEFESVELNREQVVTGGQTITVYLGPLTSGQYKFYDDFHPSMAKGSLIMVRK